MSVILIHINSSNWVNLSRCQGDQNLTLYPEDLMCTPLFVSVDFILMKKDRSRVLSGARRLGLLDSTEEPNTRKKKKKKTWRKQFYMCWALHKNARKVLLYIILNKAFTKFKNKDLNAEKQMKYEK